MKPAPPLPIWACLNLAKRIGKERAFEIVPVIASQTRIAGSLPSILEQGEGPARGRKGPWAPN